MNSNAIHYDNNNQALQTTLATHMANIENLKGRLEDVVVARQRLVELLPLVEQQHQLEKRRDMYARMLLNMKGYSRKYSVSNNSAQKVSSKSKMCNSALPLLSLCKPSPIS